jgi:hypothetical protein
LLIEKGNGKKRYPPAKATLSNTLIPLNADILIFLNTSSINKNEILTYLTNYYLLP